MSSLRQDVLRAELQRIEQEAEAMSYSIMNKADQLACAYELCERINVAEGHIQFKPQVVYHGIYGCEILIYVFEAGYFFLKRCKEESIEWGIERDASSENIILNISGYSGVFIYIKDHFVKDAIALAA